MPAWLFPNDQGTTSALAIHLARVGRLAWASTQIRMWADWNMGTECMSRTPSRRVRLWAASRWIQSCLGRQPIAYVSQRSIRRTQ